jgi:hypothetical protein
MTLADVESAFRALLLGKDETLMEGADPARQRLYRTLVRGNLSWAIRRAVPVLRKLAGEESVHALVTRFLDEKAPRTRLVRVIPIEFAAWAHALPAHELPHAAAGELAQWEALEIDVVMAPEVAELSGVTGDPVDGARIETHPSTRLAAYRHPVHTLTTSSTQWPALAREPALVLAWRSLEKLTWQALDGGTAKVLVETSAGAAIGDAFARIEATLAPGDLLDRRRVRATLVDLHRRGAIVGFVST